MGSLFLAVTGSMILLAVVKYLVTDGLVSSKTEEGNTGGTMQALFKWFGDAFAHAMGAVDAEEKRHVPPPIGMQPYRDIPLKRGHGDW